jgi:anti-sigma factor RsiW
MNCPLQREETGDVLLDYSARRLDAARTAVLEQHMEKCPKCASFRSDQALLWDALDTWEPMPVSRDFNRRLWQRIDAAAAAPWYTRVAESLRFANWKPVFPLAAAVLVIAGGFLLDQRDSREPAPGINVEAGSVKTGSVKTGSVQGVSMTEVDQLEQTLDDIQLLHQLDTVTAPTDRSSKQI